MVKLRGPKWLLLLFWCCATGKNKYLVLPTLTTIGIQASTILNRLVWNYYQFNTGILVVYILMHCIQVHCNKTTFKTMQEKRRNCTHLDCLLFIYYSCFMLFRFYGSETVVWILCRRYLDVFGWFQQRSTHITSGHSKIPNLICSGKSQITGKSINNSTTCIPTRHSKTQLRSFDQRYFSKTYTGYK
jgi:hypothetical protein